MKMLRKIIALTTLLLLFYCQPENNTQELFFKLNNKGKKKSPEKNYFEGIEHLSFCKSDWFNYIRDKTQKEKKE